MGNVALKHPLALKTLSLDEPVDMDESRPVLDVRHSTRVSRAMTSLVAPKPDVRRSLTALRVITCCSPQLVPMIPAIAACTALKSVVLLWDAGCEQAREGLARPQRR